MEQLRRETPKALMKNYSAPYGLKAGPKEAWKVLQNMVYIVNPLNYSP
jgi:hypothetical protein